MSVKPVSVEKNRLFSLDILRGLAIFGMILSSQLPSALPRWMHHNQWFADGKLQIVLGLTWVDIVFPFFLFAMGAAIPFALSRRMDKGEPLWQLIGHILWRGLVILGLAIYLGNSDPWGYGYPPDENLWIWGRTLFGFLCMVLFLGRLPFLEGKPKWMDILVKVIGLAGIAALMMTLHKADGTGFDKTQNNIIILILARVYVTASILWLITRYRPGWRVAALAAIIALRFHNGAGGPIMTQLIKFFDPVKFLYSPSIIQISTIAIMGSLIGDMMYRFLKSKKDLTLGVGISKGSLATVMVLLPLFTIGGLCYLQSRFVVSGLLFSASAGLVCLCLLSRSTTPIGKLMTEILKWGLLFLILGYILEPLEGGIKKDPSTPAYYFVTAGMATTLLVFFFILVDGLKQGKWVGFLRVVGSNAMLAYVIGGHFLYPLLHVSGIIKPIDKVVMDSVPLGTLWSFALTFLVCGGTYLFSRKKIFFRV